MNNDNGGLVKGGVIALIVIALLAIGRGGGFLPALGRTVVFVGVIAVIVIVLLVIIVISLAFKSSSEDAKDTSGNRSSKRGITAQPTSDEEALLVETKREIGQLKVLLNRINEIKIRNAGLDVCKEVEKILTALREDPKDIKGARAFLTNYVPTLSEILNKYQKLEQNGIADDAMKDKVANHLMDIQSAAEKQYRNLFDDDVLDLTVDMKALRMAAKSDGLLEDQESTVESDESDVTLKL